MDGSRSIAASINGLFAGIEVASCEASVVIRWVPVFLSTVNQEKKKLADNLPNFWKFSAICCKMADFPEPVGARESKFLWSDLRPSW